MTEFNLLTVGSWYYPDGTDRQQDEVAKLRKLGFKFKQSKDCFYFIDGNPTIRISTIGGLLRFIKRVGHDVVISLPFDDGGLPTIEIYDDYRE